MSDMQPVVSEKLSDLLRYYFCNKCGYLGKAGPEHDDCPYEASLNPAVKMAEDLESQLATALEAKQAAEQEREEARATWRCFHCGFETSDPREAEAHFGERDDAQEFTPTCTWWAKLSQEERADAVQDLQRELNAERDENAHLQTQVEGLEYRVESIASEIGSRFKGCSTIQEAWCKYDSMEGRALAAEEELAEARKKTLEEAVAAILRADYWSPADDSIAANAIRALKEPKNA